jgi:NIMA (never in mitosis gene a)-related kinase
MWSLGCIVYELCALRHAFDGDNLNALALRIMKGQYDPLPAHFGPDLRKLVQRLLARDPQTR